MSTDELILRKSGAVFSKVGVYSVLHHTDPKWEKIFITKYNLLELEGALESYKSNRTVFSQFEEHLNNIYYFCGKDRSSLHFNATNSTVDREYAFQKSIEYSKEIAKFAVNSFDDKFTEDIQKKTYIYTHDDEERTYFYPTIFEQFDDMKEFLRFHIECEIQSQEAYINISMTVPYAEDGVLYEVNYIPVINGNGEVQFLDDQSSTHLIHSHYSLFYEKDIDNCYFKKEVFMCNPKTEKVVNLLDASDSCLTSIFKDETKNKCQYRNPETDYYYLTSLNNGNFYYIAETTLEYSYECSDGDREIGSLLGTGVLTLQANCSLNTINENIFYDGTTEELLIFIDESSNIDNFSSSTISIVIISVTGVLLLIAIFIVMQLWMKRRNQYRYMYV